MIARTLAAAALVAAVAQAQSVPNLPASSFFSTTPNNPPATFTPVTTFNMASSVTPTVLTGVGPSLTTGPATFSYNIPLSTVTGYVPTSVYASLASQGLPTDATGAVAPGYNPSRQIINPNKAYPAANAASAAMAGVAAIAAAAAMLL